MYVLEVELYIYWYILPKDVQAQRNYIYGCMYMILSKNVFYVGEL